MKLKFAAPSKQTIALGISSLATLGAVAFLPNEYWPKCPVYAFTGLYCPGCGGLRATWDLMHGNVAGALNQNALIFAIPVMILGVFWAERAGAVRTKRVLVTVSVLIAVVFTLLRNLPGSWLAPDPFGI